VRAQKTKFMHVETEKIKLRNKAEYQTFFETASLVISKKCHIWQSQPI
jgi:hypothetical protein